MKARIGFPQVLFAPDGAGSAPSSPAAAPSSPAPSGGGEPSTTPSSTPSGAAPSGGDTGMPAGGSPASPSVPPAPAGPPSPLAPEVFEFDGLNEGDIEDIGGMEPPAPPTAEPAVAPAPTPPPAPPVPPAATAPAQPQPAAAPGVPGPQEAPPPLPSPAEPDKIAEQMLANAPAIIDHLAANEFKLSPEDIEALETDAPAHIPKLLARMYVRSQATMLNQLARVVPAMLQRYTQVTTRNAANEGKFYSRWPSIDKTNHGPLVSRLAATYRQMNPEASLDQMVEELGPIVMMAAKIAPGTPANGSAGAPAATPARSVPPPSPFKPALGGPAAPPNVQPENPWMGLQGATADDE